MLKILQDKDGKPLDLSGISSTSNSNNHLITSTNPTSSSLPATIKKASSTVPTRATPTSLKNDDAGAKLRAAAERNLKENVNAREERERLETERLQKLEDERLEKERIDKERLEKERLEKERLEKESSRKSPVPVRVGLRPGGFRPGGGAGTPTGLRPGGPSLRPGGGRAVSAVQSLTSDVAALNTNGLKKNYTKAEILA